MPTGQHRGDRGQIEGHRQVLDDQHREDHRSFAVAEPAQVSQHLGDHSGGGDPGDATQHERGAPIPAQQQREAGPGQCVQYGVEHPGRGGRAQIADQFIGRVFETQHDQQQDHADLGADLDELLAGRQRQQPAVPEGETGQEIERDR
jgi:hypothetical protein